ncbi:hypothetical protein T06_6324 [Trichinella sp. T6]|nr:hypothetical protein T06_6324 [Trichinella sp. T6]
MSWLRCVAAVVAVDFSSVFPTFPIDDQFINERNFYKGLVKLRQQLVEMQCTAADIQNTVYSAG